MIVFVPSCSLKQNPKLLDNARCWQQLRELRYIVALHTWELTHGWRHHPAIKMWEFHVPALIEYGHANIRELRRRGFQYPFILHCEQQLRDAFEYLGSPPITLPEWWGDTRIHDSHKARLLQKRPDFYGRYGWHLEEYMQGWETEVYQWPIWNKDNITYRIEHRGAFTSWRNK